MTAKTIEPCAARIKSRARPALLALGLAALVALAGPAAASAHGPVAPIASSYLARVDNTPAGLEAKIVDGDQRLWLQAQPGATLVVLDYRGAPYLRFSPSGVAVNENSAMYYLNQTPVPLAVPARLGPGTPPAWHVVSAGHSYGWHDGRLHALAAVALAPGATFVGHWRVPIVLNGTRTVIAGGLWHSGDPSPVWFWPILVILACVLAAWRLRRPELDRGVAKGLAVAALIATATAVLGRDLHGRPGVSVLGMIELGVVLAFALWAVYRVLFVRHGYFTYLVIAVVALWQGALLIPTLLYGFVLAAEPAFLARAACVVCLGSAISLLPMVFRLADEREASPPADPDLSELEAEDDSAWELA